MTSSSSTSVADAPTMDAGWMVTHYTPINARRHGFDSVGECASFDTRSIGRSAQVKAASAFNFLLFTDKMIPRIVFLGFAYD
jgi:hypothetical protein